MDIWAIADLHLSFGVKNKEMGVFGEKWKRHFEKIETHWREKIHEGDLVLLAGDLSWGLHESEVVPDLNWVEALPGVKVMIKGNHDLWWKSKSKVEKILPPSIHVVQNSVFNYHSVSVGGTRLWETPSINYGKYVEVVDTSHVNVHAKPNTLEEEQHDEKIFKTEIERLHTSLKLLDPNASCRIAMLHYPPAGPQHEPTQITDILSHYKIDYCVYGHIHNLKPHSPVDFQIGGVKYFCTACDWLNFSPLHLIKQ